MSETTSTWGGARPGAGRKPKAMRYAPILNAVEEYFASELMSIAIEMVKRAKENDDSIAKYIMDRMFGSPARLTDSPATDRMLPYNDANLENAVKKLEEHSENNSAIKQVKTEIFEDMVCFTQTLGDKPVIPGIRSVNIPDIETAFDQPIDAKSTQEKPQQAQSVTNTNSIRDWLSGNTGNKSFLQICRENNLDPRSIDITALRKRLNAK